MLKIKIIAIEWWKMYKTPFKSDNPSLDMILTQRNHNLWTINAKKSYFHYFWPTLQLENRSLMAIESWKMSKVPFKSDNLSLDMTLSWRNHNLRGKKAKNGQNMHFLAKNGQILAKIHPA